MSLKYVTVLVDGSDTDVRQRAAFDMARRHDARLHGIFVMPPPPTSAGPGVAQTPGLAGGIDRGMMPGGASSTAPRSDASANDPLAASERKAEQARRSFEQALASSGLKGEFEILTTRKPNAWQGLLEVPPICDLLVSGKPADSGEEKHFQRFVTESGTPVLIVPDSAREWSGDNVAIGWNGSPDAMRAVRAAFPMIEECTATTVVMVKPGSDVAASSKRLQQVLIAHGVQCEEQRDIGGDLNVSQALLSRAEMSDMLVIGAYGRSRLQEMILGGTTRNVVQQATMPLLIAH